MYKYLLELKKELIKHKIPFETSFCVDKDLIFCPDKKTFEKELKKYIDKPDIISFIGKSCMLEIEIYDNKPYVAIYGLTYESFLADFDQCIDILNKHYNKRRFLNE